MMIVYVIPIFFPQFSNRLFEIGSTVNVFPNKMSPLYFSLFMIPMTLDDTQGFPFIVIIPCSFSSLATIVLPAPATYLSNI
mgnify:CR=1 FL=1